VISVSVVVPATNAPPTLARCLAALEASDRPADEVVVVTDPALSATAARNHGAAQASGDVVVFVDADVDVHPEALGRIRAALVADDRLTAVFGSYDDAPADPGVVSAFRNLLHHHVHHGNAGPAETFWTGLGAVRRQAFLAVGGFDEEQYPHPSIEDIELGDRLRAAGHRVALDPAILGTHLKVWTVRSMVWTDFIRRGVPWVSLQVRRRRVSGALNCGWRHRLSAAATVIAVVAAALAMVPLLLAGIAALVGLNLGFYALLLRRLGPLQAVAGVALHGLHHLVAVAAVPVGVAAGLLGGVARSSEPPLVPAAATER
jgi:GT2 family glycosyltransferase